MGGDSGSLCVASPTHQVVTVGFDAMANQSEAALVLDGASLVDPEGVALDAAYVVEIGRVGEDFNLLGVWDSYPPSFNEIDDVERESKRQWDARIDVAGAELQAGEELGLVVILAPTAEAAHTGGIEVTYQTESGQTYRARTTTEIELAVGYESCREFLQDNDRWDDEDSE
jgi:hypothetical protein